MVLILTYLNVLIYKIFNKFYTTSKKFVSYLKIFFPRGYLVAYFVSHKCFNETQVSLTSSNNLIFLYNYYK